MYLFDLHCDTITRLNDGVRLEPNDRSLFANGAQLALNRMLGEHWCQCFAIFMPDEYRGSDAIDYFERSYRYFCDQMNCHSAYVAQVHNSQEAEQVIAQGKTAAILTVEGGSALAGDLSRVQRLKDCGVRMLTLTWNGENELGSGNATTNGLTGFGKAAIPVLEEAGIVVDVSHLNDTGFWEAVKMAKRPLCASHSNSRAVHPHPRNLTDDQFCFLAEHHGLVGLNYYIGFLTHDCEHVSFKHLAAHIEHFLKLGGEDILALGSDFDGADMPPWLSSVEHTRGLYTCMSKEFGQPITDKIFWKNAFRFFS